MDPLYSSQDETFAEEEISIEIAQDEHECASPIAESLGDEEHCWRIGQNLKVEVNQVDKSLTSEQSLYDEPHITRTGAKRLDHIFSFQMPMDSPSGTVRFTTQIP